MFEITARKAIRITKGDTAALAVKVEPALITGEDIMYLTVKESADDETPKMQIVCNTYDEHGYGVFFFTSEDTNIDAGDYVYDIQISYSDGHKYTIIYPTKFKVIEEITTD